MERKKSFEGAKGKRKTGWEMHRKCDDEFMQDSREGRNISSVAGGTSITASKKMGERMGADLSGETFRLR